MREELLNQFNFNPKFTPVDLLDILIVAALIYSFLLFFRRTRSHLLLYGIAITFGLYFFAKLAHLQLTLFMLHSFVGTSIIVFAIIFQAEIRKYLEVLGLIGTRQFRVGPLAPVSPTTTEIVMACLEMKKDKVGALIVFQGLDSLDNLVAGGISLDGIISEELLLSIFSPETGGHDGAVLIKNNRIAKFAVQLPLSKNFKELKKHGTRHSAALGLSENSDALCVVVSEEKGTISVCKNGKLKTLTDNEHLENELEKYIKLKFSDRKNNVATYFLKHNLILKIISILAAGGLLMLIKIII